MSNYRIRVIDRDSAAEVTWVAERMRATLVEVLGEERGGSMYTHEWLEQRVRWHLDAEQCIGQVFVAETSDGRLVGHTIVRVDRDGDGRDIGLFSTTYVEPSARRDGVATSLLARGEAWMQERGLTEAVTYTDEDNTRLQNLYLGRGYSMSGMPERFVKLARRLPARAP